MDLRTLPKVRDSLSYLYVEHCRIDQEAKAIALHDAKGKTPVPCANLLLLMLGPGTLISHAAVRVLAESGCLVCWVGEEGVRFYAQGLGETRSAHGLLRQASLASHPKSRLAVVMKMYRMRFREALPAGLSLEQIRGKEGIRVREAYARASRESGVPWKGRSYHRDGWQDADAVNRALSAANSCLYGVCHAAIVAAGFSPGIGFIHTGKMLSFVYDIADLYKPEITIPAAFRAAAVGDENIESRARHACRDLFREQQLVARIVPDIKAALSVAGDDSAPPDFDWDAAAPGGLWDPNGAVIEGGVNYADGEPKPEDAP
jgi:CRISPR-associated protein Cas1